MSILADKPVIHDIGSTKITNRVVPAHRRSVSTLKLTRVYSLLFVKTSKHTLVLCTWAGDEQEVPFCKMMKMTMTGKTRHL